MQITIAQTVTLTGIILIIVTVTARIININAITANTLASIIKNILTNTGTGALINMITASARNTTLTVVTPQLTAGDFLTGRERPCFGEDMDAFSVSSWVQGSEVLDYENLEP